MFATKRARNIALVLAILVLLVGTTLPGSVKEQVEGRLWQGWPWSASAHFLLFALIAAIPRYGEDGWTILRALALGLVLACLTEWLQNFVPGRHPLVRDGLIDLGGTAAGLAAAVLSWKRKERLRGTSSESVA